MADDITELVRLLREKPDITSHCAASCIEGFQRKAAKVSPDPVVVRLERENKELREQLELNYEIGILEIPILLDEARKLYEARADNARLRGLLREAVTRCDSTSSIRKYDGLRLGEDWFKRVIADLEVAP